MINSMQIIDADDMYKSETLLGRNCWSRRIGKMRPRW